MCNITTEPVFQYTLHKKMWNILVDNPGMTKDEALARFFTEEERKEFKCLECTACTYTCQDGRTNKECSLCPLDSSNAQTDPIMKIEEGCLNGVFGAWCVVTELLCNSYTIDQYLWYIYDNRDEVSHVMDYLGDDCTEEKLKELCSKYARIIADLPVKAGVKYI